jgi:beta-RFAP synthase
MSRVEVTTGSRLHFGLWSLDGSSSRRFGGVGLMVDDPRLRLSIEDAERLTATGPEAVRVVRFARHWADHHGLPEPRVRIDLHTVIPPHAGLGSGTQLGLSIAAGLSAFRGLPRQTAQELAISVGRGLRSAIGTYGFAFGGLLIEQGKLPDEPISPLISRLDVPDKWRFVLLRPRQLMGISGEDEMAAFDTLSSVPQAMTNRLINLANDRLIPAAITADFLTFAESLYEYGRLSGECFAARQGGPFNGPVLASLVEQVRAMGHAGVGQSSWGPTIFVALPSSEAAQQFVHDLNGAPFRGDVDTLTTAPDNCGARVHVDGMVELPVTD